MASYITIQVDSLSDWNLKIFQSWIVSSSTWQNSGPLLKIQALSESYGSLLMLPLWATVTARQSIVASESSM